MKLTDVPMPNCQSDITIETNAFYNCQALSQITIPNNCTIGKGAFDRYFNLKDIIIEGLYYQNSIGHYDDISDCPVLITMKPRQGITEISKSQFTNSPISFLELLEGLTSIGEMAFSNNKNLQSVTLPDSLKKWEPGAFWQYASLKTINIPEGLTEIPSGTFTECHALEEIYIPNSVQKVGYRVFFPCNNLKNVSVSRNTEIDGQSFPAESIAYR